MNFINNMSVKMKIATLLFISVASFMILGIVSIKNSAKLNNLTISLYDENYIPLSQIAQINDLMRTNLQQILLAGYHDPSLEVSKEHEKTHNVDMHLAEVPKNAKKITELWNAYIKKDMSEEEKKLSEEYASLRAEFVKTGLLQTVQLFKEGKYNKAQFHIGLKAIPTFNEAKGKAEELLNLQKELAAAKTTNAQNIYAIVKTSLISVIVISLTLLTLIGILTIKNIISSVNSVQSGLILFFDFLNKKTLKAELIIVDSKDEFGEMAHAINENISSYEKKFAEQHQSLLEFEKVCQNASKGFLFNRINSRYSDENLNQLSSSLNALLNNVEETFSSTFNILIEFSKGNYSSNSNINHNSKGTFASLQQAILSVSTSNSEIFSIISKFSNELNQDANILSESGEELSTSANQQASSLEETAAAIEELTSNVSANVAKTEEMTKVAQEAKNAAQHGNNVANESLNAINEIVNATEAINQAVSIIDNIAFQTNILSLNAAVEAATAGDAGKGFAVVAQEVRNLANRSADAAKEILELARTARTKSQNGLETSQNMMDSFNLISEKIVQTDEMVRDVANANREQMTGISQINDAVTQLDQITQQNAKVANNVAEISNEILNKTQQFEKMLTHVSFDTTVEKQSCNVDMIFNTSKLKIDHIVFKENNYKKLKDNNTSWKVTSHHDCNLGKWIDANVNKSFAKTSQWQELLAFHEKVHNGTQAFIDADIANESVQKIEQISAHLEESTLGVFKGLDNIKNINCLDEAKK